MQISTEVLAQDSVPAQSVAPRIEIAFLALGKKLRWFLDQMGWDISRWREVTEKGVGNVKYTEIERAAQALCMPLSYFYNKSHFSGAEIREGEKRIDAPKFFVDGDAEYGAAFAVLCEHDRFRAIAVASGVDFETLEKIREGACRVSIPLLVSILACAPQVIERDDDLGDAYKQLLSLLQYVPEVHRGQHEQLLSSHSKPLVASPVPQADLEPEPAEKLDDVGDAAIEEVAADACLPTAEEKGGIAALLQIDVSADVDTTENRALLAKWIEDQLVQALKDKTESKRVGRPYNKNQLSERLRKKDLEQQRRYLGYNLCERKAPLTLELIQSLEEIFAKQCGVSQETPTTEEPAVRHISEESTVRTTSDSSSVDWEVIAQMLVAHTDLALALRTLSEIAQKLDRSGREALCRYVMKTLTEE